MDGNNFDGGFDGSVAIVGMAVRVPGASNLEEFWQNLARGTESITFFSREELLASDVNEAALSDPHYVKASPMIADPDKFDAEYFNYSPRETVFIDPQHRAFLECSVDALEAAGCDPGSYGGSIGVFAGSGLNTYQISLMTAFQQELRSSGALQSMFLQGNDKDYLSTRVSYKLNLRGPSITVQTACSTSLVAVHLACQSILSGECDMALAGGVSLRHYSKGGYHFIEGGMLSPDGHCRPFDAAAKGTIFGDGVGVVVLKKLDRALADRDPIRAVIRGSAINNDGSGKVGYAAPSVNGQAAVIMEAQAMAGVTPESIGYIEAHGTGTELGDPIEIAALSQVFGVATQRKNFCAIGSVKSNIGHLNTAAGVIGLVKTVLSLERAHLPASLNFNTPNPKIDFANSPFYVNTTLTPWDSGKSRLAGVNSFGVGGTNAHVVLEEPPAIASDPSRRQWHTLLVTGRSPAVLDAASQQLADHLRDRGEDSLPDIAHTLATGRRFHRFCRAIVCDSASSAETALRTKNPARTVAGERRTQAASVAFMFPGQGSQRVRMGWQLYQEERRFREEMDRCLEILAPRLSFNLRDIIFPPAENDEEAASRLNDTEVAQPAIFAVSYALAKLWMSNGVQPRALIGHSIGEIVAACIAGVFPLETALSIVAVRGKLMQALPRGSMLAAAASAAAVRPYVQENISIAAVNAAASCVLSGPTEAIADLEQSLLKNGIVSSRLRTSHAFHSNMMQCAVPAFVQAIDGFEFSAPAIPFISNVTGTWISEHEATSPEYWGRQLRETVRFADGIRTLLQGEVTTFLEVGPGRSLAGLVSQREDEGKSPTLVSSLPFKGPGSGEIEDFGRARAQLWLDGSPVRWDELYAGEERRKLALPSYPFDRKRYWIEPNSDRVAARSRPTRTGAAFLIPSWKRVAPRIGRKDGSAPGNWLVFCSDDDLSRAFVEKVRACGADPAIVTIGDQFEQVDDLTFALAPDNPGHFAALMTRLASLGRSPDRVVYLWSALPGQPPASRLQPDLGLSFHGLLHLVQALDRTSGNRVEVAAVTVDTEEVIGGETVSPVAAIARGPCFVGTVECEKVFCRYVDLSSADAGLLSSTMDRLVQDLAAASAGGLVAYRHGQAWIRIYERAELGETPPSAGLLKEGGIYLITGGLGDLGLALAKAFAERARAKLVLLSRTKLPAEESWDQYMAAADTDDRIALVIGHLREIKAAGAEVLTAAVDVSDEPAMRAVAEQVAARFGPLDGVVHAAGIGGSGPLAFTNAESTRHVLRPKVEGTLVLDQVFGRPDLDFFVLFSSVSALSGYIGHVDYSAANAFLDAFASSWASSPRNVVSINWDAWNEIGMAKKKAVPEQLRGAHAKALQSGIQTEQGIDALFRILNTGLRQVVVAKRSGPWADASVSEPSSDAGSPTQTSDTTASKTPDEVSRHPRPDLSVSYAAPNTELEQIVAEIWANLLKLDRVGIHDDFFELGGHSLLALQMIPRLRDRFQVEISPRDLFAASTVHEAAQILEEKLITEIEQLEPGTEQVA